MTFTQALTELRDYGLGTGCYVARKADEGLPHRISIGSKGRVIFGKSYYTQECLTSATDWVVYGKNGEILLDSNHVPW